MKGPLADSQKWDPFSSFPQTSIQSETTAEHRSVARPCAKHCGYSKCKVKALSSKAAELQGKGARPQRSQLNPESDATMWREEMGESK